MLKLFIYGPYHYDDINYISENCNHLLSELDGITVVLFTSSIARVDDVITKYCQMKGYPIIHMNGIDEVLSNINLAVIFHNGFSVETREIIKDINNRNIPNRIIEFKDEML